VQLFACEGSGLSVTGEWWLHYIIIAKMVNYTLYTGNYTLYTGNYTLYTGN
jgi:hypothetical protein